jgi:hypothetical protein
MRKRTLVMFVIAVVGVAAPGFAQQQRPYRGLFGGGVGRTGETLELTADFGAGYDTNVLSTSNGAEEPGQIKSAGTFNSVSASLAYQESTKRVSVHASFMTAATFYPTLQTGTVVSQSAGMGVTFAVTHRTQIAAGVGVAFQPLYLLAGLPPIAEQPFGLPSTLSNGLGAHASEHANISGSVSISQSLSQRTTATFGFTRYSTTEALFSNQGLASNAVNAGLSVALAQGLSAGVGYSYSNGGFSESGSVMRNSSITGGLQFSRALSVSRKAKLSFSTGTSFITYQGVTHFDFIGSASLSREIGRSWATTISYYRNAALSETFRQPIMSDTVNGSLTGMVNRRLQLEVNGGFAHGDVGFDPTAQPFHALYASVSSTVGLTRTIGLVTTYGYYRYNFAEGIELPHGLPIRSDRQAVSVGLSFWLPLIERRRSG